MYRLKCGDAVDNKYAPFITRCNSDRSYTAYKEFPYFTFSTNFEVNFVES